MKDEYQRKGLISVIYNLLLEDEYKMTTLKQVRQGDFNKEIKEVIWNVIWGKE